MNETHSEETDEFGGRLLLVLERQRERLHTVLF